MASMRPGAVVAVSTVSWAVGAVCATFFWRRLFQKYVVSGQPVSATTPDEGTPQGVFQQIVDNLNNAGLGVRFLDKGSAPLVVTEADVLAAQAAWASAIKAISKVYLDKGDFVACAANAAAELYGYAHSKVLFKPTKAAKYPFRPTGTEAMSYFVGGAAVEGGYDEDAGFAHNGGKGWVEVKFENHQIDLNNNVAIAMGEYFFTSAADGSVAKVEYTFGYKKNLDGQLRIFLHHSSVPYAVH